MDTTPGHIAHVAINADDLDASRAFYEATFGWTFSPHFGMDDFLRIDAPDGGRPGPFAVLQRRRDLGTTRVAGGECTVAVDDLAAAVSAAVAAGGQLLLEPTPIPGVGTLAWLADPAGNPVGAMQYDLPPG
jgi:predicted enzyme related to lactoylglutathione lyase